MFYSVNQGKQNTLPPGYWYFSGLDDRSHCQEEQDLPKQLAGGLDRLFRAGQRRTVLVLLQRDRRLQT